MSLTHQESAEGKWQKLNLAEQIGNIGAELARAKTFSKKGLIENKINALERALELIDLTLASAESQPKLKELARWREAVASLFLGEDNYLASFNNLENFYLPFAILARK